MKCLRERRGGGGGGGGLPAMKVWPVDAQSDKNEAVLRVWKIYRVAFWSILFSAASTNGYHFGKDSDIILYAVG